MTKDEIVNAFNIWMHKFATDPTGFEEHMQTIVRHVTELNEGRLPSYGETAAAYLMSLADPMHAVEVARVAAS